PLDKKAVTSLAFRPNEATESLPKTIRLPLPIITTAEPSDTRRLSPLKIVLPATSACPPRLALVAPATDPTISEPANAEPAKSNPRISNNNETRALAPFFAIDNLPLTGGRREFLSRP